MRSITQSPNDTGIEYTLWLKAGKDERLASDVKAKRQTRTLRVKDSLCGRFGIAKLNKQLCSISVNDMLALQTDLQNFDLELASPMMMMIMRLVIGRR